MTNARAKFKMARQPIKKYSEEFIEAKKYKKKLNIVQNDRKLYELEIVDTKKKEGMVKLHFKGYSEKYDEWRRCDDENIPVSRLERRSIPTEDSLQDRLTSFHESLYRDVKRKLYSIRRDNPDIRIDIPTDKDVFEGGLKKVKATASFKRGKTVYVVSWNRDLDPVLGVKWDERILNENGDFAFVVNGTVCFWCIERQGIKEFKLIGGRYVESFIEEADNLIFTFVRGDGNRHTYGRNTQQLWDFILFYSMFSQYLLYNTNKHDSFVYRLPYFLYHVPKISSKFPSSNE